MNSFITGSQSYGNVTKDSDVDLVIRLSEEDCDIIMDYCDNPPLSPESKEYYGQDGLHNVRFGKLNILICTTDAQFAAWKLGTDKCQKKDHTLDREEAVKVFSEIFTNFDLGKPREEAVKVSSEIFPNFDLGKLK